MEDLYTKAKMDILEDISRLKPPESGEKKEAEKEPDPCEKCRWRAAGRPCVMPEGVCKL